jgi:hypothetical protein
MNVLDNISFRKSNYFRLILSSIPFSAIALQSKLRSLLGGVVDIPSTLDACSEAVLFELVILDPFVDCVIVQHMLCGVVK